MDEYRTYKMSRKRKTAIELTIVLIFCLVSWLFTQFGYNDKHTDVVAVVWCTFITIVVAKLICKMPASSLEKRIVCLSYVSRIMFILAENITNNFVRINIFKSGDANAFARYARNYYLGDKSSILTFYSKFISYEYEMFGLNENIAIYTNVLFFVMSIYFAYKILEIAGVSSRHQWIPLCIFCFSPYYFIETTALFKESILVLLHILVMYGCVMWIYGKSKIYIIISMMSGLLAALFHSGAIFSFITVVLLLIVYDRDKIRFLVTPKTLMIGILFFVIILLSITFAPIRKIIWNKVYFMDDIIETIRTPYYAHLNEHGGSEYLVNMQLNDVTDLIIYTPIRMFYFLCSPLPMDFRGPSDAIFFCIDGLIYGFVLLCSVWFVLKSTNRKNIVIVIYGLIVILLMMAMFSWGCCAAGTAMRHRGTSIGIVFVLLSIFIHNREKKINEQPV